MAQALYNSYKEDLLDSTAQNFAGGSMDVIFVETGYTFSASHTVFTDLSVTVGDGGTGRANAENLVSPSVTSGVADANDTVFASCTIASTDIAAFVVFYDSGVDATSTLVGFFDSISNFDPGGAQVTIAYDASGIFTL